MKECVYYVFTLLLQRPKKVVLEGFVMVVKGNGVEYGKKVGRRTKKIWKSRRVRMGLKEK